MRKTDEKTLDLIKEVEKRKKEILKLERPNWLTNCCFPTDEHDLNSSVNLHVESNVQRLIGYAAHIMNKEKLYIEAAEHLGVKAPDFTWGSFGSYAWLADIKMRIDQIQIKEKKNKLAALEGRLNAVISPELKAEMELQAIADELG